MTSIIIPARMASTRLEGKPLADIGGKPMIVRVMDKAMEADIGSVLIATDSKEIAQCIHDHGGQAVMTDKNHASGSDRVWEAAQSINGDENEIIVNLQGDLPTIRPEVIRAGLTPLKDKNVDFATLATPITEPTEAKNENVVKLVGSLISPTILKALYFTRAPAPWGDGIRYHHIGLYAWRRKALKRFVALPPSPLEKRERLEQLRALEAGMNCHAALVDTKPLGVDTQEDLEQARMIVG